MTVIRGTWHDGRVVLDEQVEWPNGQRVLVESAGPSNGIGLSEDQWDDSPEGIAAWLKWYDSLEPLEFTADDEARIAS